MRFGMQLFVSLNGINMFDGSNKTFQVIKTNSFQIKLKFKLLLKKL